MAIDRKRTKASAQITVAALTALGFARAALADYEAPDPQWAAPANYYSSATGTGAALKLQLYTITSTGFVARSYGDSRYNMGTVDSDGTTSKPGLYQDPNNASNIRLVYTDTSIPGGWDSGMTWNREHVFPKNWLNLTSSQVSNTYKGVASDEFELMPADPVVNSTRNDYGYGNTSITPPHSAAVVGTGTNTYWYPGDQDRGDVARSLFYMATRYAFNQTKNGVVTNLSLVNGPPTQLYTMGDLASLVKWNYEDGIDNYERRRNQYTYSSTLNPNYYQGNRNPYIDHPEYVWAVFGSGPSDAKVYVGPTVPSSGASSVSLDLGRVIVGGTIQGTTYAINKVGADPTTYDVTLGGEAASSAAGVGQPFDYNNQVRTIPIGLSSSTSTAGAKSGTISIDDTDLTSSGTGMGSADGNDVINISATVLAHSKASLNSSSQATSLTLNFGTVAQGIGSVSLPFGVTDLSNVAGFTAGLDLDSINGSGSTSTLTTNLGTFTALAAGSTNSYSASLNTANLGTYTATYTLATSDENLSGATAGPTLTLTLTGNILQRQWYTDANATWSASSDWLGPVPHVAGDTANFLNVITAPRTVTLDAAQTAAHVTFNSSFAYTLTGSTLTLSNTSGSADVNVNLGSHVISAPVAIASSTTATIATNTALSLSDLSISSNKILTKAGNGTLTISGTQTPAAGAALVASAGTTNLNSDPGSNLALTANATVNIGAQPGPGISAMHLGTVSVGNGGAVTLAAPTDHGNRTVLLAAGLNFAGSTDAWQGKVDLTSNDLIVQNGNLADLTNQIRMGETFADIPWSGTAGITSSAAIDTQHRFAVGVIQNSDNSGNPIYGTTTSFGPFDGQSPSANDVLIKFTYVGDADLNGQIDAADYSHIDNGANSAGTLLGWINGDFNYDGSIDAADYTLIDNAANNQTAGVLENSVSLVAGSTAQVAAVPEPTAGLVAGLMLLRRRRRS